MIKKFYLCVLILFVSSFIYSQVNRETRAVWLTTNFRLDWPPPVYNADTQKKALIKILDDLKDKKFNTIYFQVRFNGTVLYKSDMEPYSYYLTGEVGDLPEYDPLEFILKEAHLRGIEVHAWLNMINTFSGSEQKILANKDHLYKTHPNWLIQWTEDNKKSYWIDPGIPEAREYLCRIATEVAEKYDIDGLHFDFLRYPGRTFNDQLSYAEYGNEGNKDDWRRNNLTSLVENIYNSVKAIKPLIKIGVAPIGIYKNRPGATGWEGFSEVYQDSRTWLKRGIIDYVVPQIYWDFKNNPHFDILAKDWQDNSYNRTVILGIGAYQKSVYPEMDKMIAYSREINAGGVAFFRYENIKNYNSKLFSEYSFPNLMPWIKANLPEPPSNLHFELSGSFSSTIKLLWEQSNNSINNTKYYSIYWLNNKTSEFNSTSLLDVISSNKQSISLPLHRPRKTINYFSVKSLNNLWYESENSSNICEVKIPQLYDFSESVKGTEKPSLVSDNNNSILLLNVQSNEKIEIIGETDTESKALITQVIPRGTNYISLSNINKYKLLKVNYLVQNKNFTLKLK